MMREHTSPRAVVSRDTRDRVLTPLANVSRRADLGELATRLAELRDWLASDLSDLEHHLKSIDVQEKREVAWSAANYLLEQRGKRVRPLCVMLAARMGGRPLDAAVRDVAVACELVHTATLLHDDVIDCGTDRRGVPSARMIYGNAASVLGGDHLLVESLRRISRAFPKHVDSLLEVIDGMIRAEALQLELRRAFTLSREQYLEVVDGKTAGLFCWGLRVGGELGALAPTHVETLAGVGADLGMTFQLVDDVLDLDGDPTTTGKNAFADLREGKLTWPLILAAEHTPALGKRIERFVADERAIEDEEAAEIARAVVATGAIEATRAEAAAYAGRALDGLATLPAGTARLSLETVVETALSRSH